MQIRQMIRFAGLAFLRHFRTINILHACIPLIVAKISKFKQVWLLIHSVLVQSGA